MKSLRRVLKTKTRRRLCADKKATRRASGRIVYNYEKINTCHTIKAHIQAAASAVGT